MSENEMVNKKTWKEFRDTGLLLLINQFLHIFGWAIVCVIDTDDPSESVLECYPARVRFRGFDDKSTSEAYKKIAHFMKDNNEDLISEAEE